MSRRVAPAPDEQAGWYQSKTVVVAMNRKKQVKKFRKMVADEGWEILHERTRGSWEFRPGQSEFTLRRPAR